MDAMIRVLKLSTPNREVDVPVRIFWPTQEKHSWFCRWEIDWPDRKRTNSAGGADQVQAMVHALQMVGAELYSSDAHAAGKLAWDPTHTGYGFPVPTNFRTRLIGDDRDSL